MTRRTDGETATFLPLGAGAEVVHGRRGNGHDVVEAGLSGGELDVIGRVRQREASEATAANVD